MIMVWNTFVIGEVPREDNSLNKVTSGEHSIFKNFFPFKLKVQIPTLYGQFTIDHRIEE